jgi:hypothetical protein
VHSHFNPLQYITLHYRYDTEFSTYVAHVMTDFTPVSETHRFHSTSTECRPVTSTWLLLHDGLITCVKEMKQTFNLCVYCNNNKNTRPHSLSESLYNSLIKRAIILLCQRPFEGAKRCISRTCVQTPWCPPDTFSFWFHVWFPIYFPFSEKWFIYQEINSLCKGRKENRQTYTRE